MLIKDVSILQKCVTVLMIVAIILMNLVVVSEDWCLLFLNVFTFYLGFLKYLRIYIKEYFYDILTLNIFISIFIQELNIQADCLCIHFHMIDSFLLANRDKWGEKLFK